MSEEKIEPALTLEEWAEVLVSGAMLRHSSGDRADVTPEGRHALAAVSLYGQPFGFTRTDVKTLLMAVAIAGKWLDLQVNAYPDHVALPILLLDLRDRIEALLPPESPSVAGTEAWSTPTFGDHSIGGRTVKGGFTAKVKEPPTD